ncbi:MAG: iron ABC transporter permease [Spirochaetes bacterium]|nr:iron ABC transporter permease [Spirochaetota bacterium]
MKKAALVILYATAPLIILISLMVSTTSEITPSVIISYFCGNITDMATHNLIGTIIFDVRLPRIILAFIVGASLSMSGHALQALFRNPLVEPYILGISSGAAFGAALCIATALASIQLGAFCFGFIAAIMSYFFAREGNRVSIVSLLLSGVLISGIFTALLAIVQFLSDPFRLQTIVHWTMGNLHTATWAKVRSSALPIFIGAIWLFLMRWRINVLALGDEEAASVGLHPEREKILVLIPATLVVTSSVAMAGVIGMVGLIVPHMSRMLFGSDNKASLPASAVFGGSFLLVVDDLSRTFMAFELPIGIFTIVIGAPLFFYLLKKTRLGMGA